MDKVGEKIKYLRRIKGLSQLDLCEGICSQSELSKIENSKLYPNLSLCNELSKRLGVTIDSIINKDIEFYHQMDIEKILNLLYMRRYKRCMYLIQKLPDDVISKNIYTINYIKTTCEHNLNKCTKKTTIDLEDKFLKNYNPLKKRFTSIEIQILNLLGSIYIELDPLNIKGILYLEKSLILMDSILIKDIHYRALSKCYYCASKVAFNQSKYSESVDLAIHGINWCISNQTLYFLYDLYQILMLNYKQQGEIKLTNKTKRIIKTLKVINSSYI